MRRTGLLVFLVCVGLATAYTTLEVVTECPHHPGMCFDSTTNEFYQEGATWSRPGQCVEFTCHFPHIQGNGCPPVPPGCSVQTENLELTYPNCCPHAACPGHA